MSRVALRLPDSLHERVRVLAERDNTSLNQFITLAVTEKVSSLETANFFREACQTRRLGRAERDPRQSARRSAAAGNERV